MAKRQVSNGSSRHKVLLKTMSRMSSHYMHHLNILFQEVTTRFRSHYIIITAAFAVVLLTFMLPDLSQKIREKEELNAMKKVVAEMTEEIVRAEVACLTDAQELNFLYEAIDDGDIPSSPGSPVSSHSDELTSKSEPIQGEKNAGFFRRLFYPHRNVSRKEIAISSIIYTESFDGRKKPI